MLRKTVIVLIVFNLLWWVWARDWLAPIGLSSAPAGEPERLARQLRPELLHIKPLPPGTSPGAATPDASPSDTDTDAPRRRNRRR